MLERVIAVICTLAERGLAFRGEDETFGSPNNGNQYRDEVFFIGVVGVGGMLIGREIEAEPFHMTS